MTTAKLIPDLQRDEGLRLQAYKDTVGIWTIGYGHAHVTPGLVWTESQALKQLDQDVEETRQELDTKLPWWKNLDDRRQDALLNMAFNMGTEDLLTFNQFLSYLQRGRFEEAANDLRGTKWFGQVGSRAQRIQDIIRNGT